MNKGLTGLGLSFLFSIAFFVSTAPADEVGSGLDSKSFPKPINHFLSTHCVSCHGSDKQKGKFRIDVLNQDLVGGPHGEDWHEVLNALKKGEMPPEDEKQPTAGELTEMVDFLEKAFKDATAVRNSTGGRAVMRRLNNFEYNNTINDLLGLYGDVNFSKDFPPDSFGPDGFTNNGAYLGISAMQLESYLEAANRALDEAIIRGEQPDLKAADIKVDQYLERADGLRIDLRTKQQQRNIGGLLAWQDFPRRGPVLVEATLDGADDPDALIGRLKLEIGQRTRKKGSPLYSFGETKVSPAVFKKDGLIHVRYLVPKIEAFPQPKPRGVVGVKDSGFSQMVLNLTLDGDARGVRVQSMRAKGPYYESWPPRSYQQVFIPSKNIGNEDVYAREIIETFMARAWRREVTGQEVDVLFKAYQKHRQEMDFVEAIKKALVRVLIAPEFLYLLEPQSPESKREKLNGHELANRLSYFLWSSMPDAELSQLAREGALDSPGKVRLQVQRLLQDRRFERFVDQFTSQWLGLYKMNSIAVSPEVYPWFDERLKVDMKGQTRHFFAHVVRENLSAWNFIDSDFTFLNERLDNHYRTKGTKGPRFGGSTVFKKVDLPEDSERGGLLSHGSIHLANSDGEDSHPIALGVWLADRILGNPPPSPPADIEFDENIEGFGKMTLKQQLEVHLQKESCARCHVKIDPFGVAFENYDVVGVFRNQVRKLDEEELERKLAAVTRSAAEVEEEFNNLDRDHSRWLTYEEWLPHARATLPEGKQSEQSLRRIFSKLADVGRDRENNTHPEFTVTLAEYQNNASRAEAKAVAEINEKLPYRYLPVDANTVLPDKTEVDGLGGLQDYLLAHRKDEFAENLVRRLLTYALGRTLEFSDQPTIERLTGQFEENDYKLGTLIEEIVLCDLFQTK